MISVAVNLIPRAHLEQRRASTRVARWGVCCGVLACAVATAWIVTSSRVVDNREELAAQLASAKRTAEEKERLVADTRAAHSAAIRRLESARAVAGHPDWSVLLALLARARGDGLVLDRVEVRPIARIDPQAQTGLGRTGVATAERVEAGYQLDLRGVGESQSTVTQYLLSLERTGIFESVRLRETRPRTIGARGVVEFGLDGAIVAGKVPRPPGVPSAEQAAAEGGSPR